MDVGLSAQHAGPAEPGKKTAFQGFSWNCVGLKTPIVVIVMAIMITIPIALIITALRITIVITIIQ